MCLPAGTKSTCFECAHWTLADPLDPSAWSRGFVWAVRSCQINHRGERRLFFFWPHHGALLDIDNQRTRAPSGDDKKEGLSRTGSACSGGWPKWHNDCADGRINLLSLNFFLVFLLSPDYKLSHLSLSSLHSHACAVGALVGLLIPAICGQKNYLLFLGRVD